MSTGKTKYFGTSFKYLRSLDTRGRQELISGSDNLKQSIAYILGTEKGTEFMNRSKGSNLNLLQFEPNDVILASLLDFHISDALSEQEKRIKLLDVKYEFLDGGKVNCTLEYIEVASGNSDTFVYPFYRILE